MGQNVNVQHEKNETVLAAIEGQGEGVEAVEGEGAVDDGEGFADFGLGALADGVGGLGGEEEVNSVDEVGVWGGGRI